MQKYQKEKGEEIIILYRESVMLESSKSFISWLGPMLHTCSVPGEDRRVQWGAPWPMSNVQWDRRHTALHGPAKLWNGTDALLGSLPVHRKNNSYFNRHGLWLLQTLSVCVCVCVCLSVCVSVLLLRLIYRLLDFNQTWWKCWNFGPIDCIKISLRYALYNGSMG